MIQVDKCKQCGRKLRLTEPKPDSQAEPKWVHKWSGVRRCIAKSASTDRKWDKAFAVPVGQIRLGGSTE